jgi:hypothetical protein
MAVLQISDLPAKSVQQVDSTWEAHQTADEPDRTFRITHTEVFFVTGSEDLSSDAAIEAAMGGER